MTEYIAVVVADQDAGIVGEMTGEKALSLLSVVGKPLVFHTIEALALAGIREVHILAGGHADQIRKAVGPGRRWGLRVDVSALPGSSVETVAELWGGLGVLVLQGDRLRSPRLSTLLEQGGRPGRVVGQMNGEDAGAVLVTRGGTESHVEEIGGQCVAIATAADFHAANLNAVSGAMAGLLLSGRHVVADCEDELIVGRGGSVSADCLVRGKTWVGEFCRVPESVRFTGRVVVGPHSIIDEGTSIADSVVMPGTYVGPDLDIRNAIVAGANIFQVDIGLKARIADPFLLSALRF